MGKYSRPEVEYIADEGFVRLNLRRPVNLYVPSELQESYDPTEDGEEPSAALQLDWVHGYRGRDCRNNLFPLASGEIIYFTAGVSVIYNPENGTQRHYVEHTDDIKCLCVHPDGKTIATGQIKGTTEGAVPHVRIWDSESLETLHEFGSDTFSRGVNCVAFSKDSGDLLACVDDSPEPVLSVWKWQDQEKMSECKASADPVIAVTFSGENPSRIVTSGKSHLAFWTMAEDGSELKKRTGIFGDHEKPKYITAVASLPSGEIITGDSNGNIYVWEGGEQTIRHNIDGAHDGPILNIFVCSSEGNVMSAGKDNKLATYDGELEPLDMVKEVPEEYGSPRVVFHLNDKFYIGTTTNAIIETTFQDDHKILTKGHTEELWGLATHPSDPHFITAGHDGKVYGRDATTHEILWCKDLEMACQSVDISPSGDITVVGGNSGKWVALDNESQEVIHEGEDGEEPFQATRFSPDGSKLALGSRDNSIYVYDFDAEEKTFSKRGQCEGHSSFITHLDWSQDGEMLRTNSGDYEVLCWKVEDCSHETEADNYKDVEWATNNCILAFNALGIWPPSTDGTHINGANKAHGKDLIASGDDFGLVKLFAFPARVQNAKHHAYRGHSSHVTTVAFLHDDSLLLSTGGRDTSIMQWKVNAVEE